MKELIEKYIASKDKFREEEREFEKAFGEFLESIPGWYDIIGSIIVSNGYGSLPENLDYEHPGDCLIPQVRDINLCGGPEESQRRISFKIRIPSDTWVSKYLETGWFPLTWLTNPGSAHIDKEYLKGKLRRRAESLMRYQKEEDQIKSQIKEIEDEMKKIKELIEKED